MAAYIEREAIKYELWSVGPLNEPLMVVRKKTIDRIPAADVAPVRHAQWIKDESGTIICSECGEEHDWQEYRANYCDVCGAKMDLKEGGEE